MGHDVGDRRLSPDIVREICVELGIELTLDGASNDKGTNAQCDRYCSPSKSFLETQVDGETIWLNPPFNQIDEFLDHYMVCKRRAPDTSTCLVLPDWQAPWRAKVSHMKVVKKFPAGSYLFDQPVNGVRKRMGPTPWGVSVYYDPPVMNHVYAASAAARATGLTMRFIAMLNGRSVVALVDTGAERSLLSTRVADERAVAQSEPQTSLQQVAGTRVHVRGACVATVQLGAAVSLPMLVLPMTDHFDVVLGQDWCTLVGASPCFESPPRLLLRHGMSIPCPAVESLPNTKVAVVSAAVVQEWLQGDSQVPTHERHA